MEYIDGEDLASLLRRIGRLPPDKALELSRQLCAGLAAAHDRKVLHRDLKPANVLIDGRGRAHLADFGLANLTDQRRDTREVAGTPGYMAPEQLQGREVTTRTDVYALGLVLYEMFTGMRALTVDGALPASPSTHIPDLNPDIERVILRCLERDPTRRPPSAIAVAAGLAGGNPLAAAIAAGETPSPDMVAAAGAPGTLSPAVGALCFAGVLIGLTLLASWAGRFDSGGFTAPATTRISSTRTTGRRFSLPVNAAWPRSTTGWRVKWSTRCDSETHLYFHLPRKPAKPASGNFQVDWSR